MGSVRTGGGKLTVQDEGITIGRFGTMNFIGGSIAATDGGNGVVNITVSGGSTAWQLDGNLNAAEKYIGTNDNFDFPIYTNATRRITVKNTGFTGFRTTSPTTLVHILSDNTTVNNTNALTLGSQGVGATAAFTGLMWNCWVNNFAANPCIYTYATFDTINAYDSRYTIATHDGGSGFIDTLSCQLGKVGIGTIHPTSKLHIIGDDSTSSTYSLKIENSALSSIVSVRNDGKVLIQGLTAGLGNSAVISNTAFGINALASNGFGGLYNIAIGVNSLTTNSSGINNTSVGADSMRLNVDGAYNTSVGRQGLENNTNGSFNTAVGVTAMNFNTTGGGNTAVGVDSLRSNITTNNNTGVGRRALYNSNGGDNTGVGKDCLLNTSSGGANTAIGENAGATNQTGNFNVFFGLNADTTVTNLDNQIAIGYNAIVSAQNSMVLGNTVVKVGMGISSPTAKLHIVSLGSSSATYSLKIENVAVATLLSITDNGIISMPLSPVGNSGLSSGDTYFDTAANILSNGDLILARKV